MTNDKISVLVVDDSALMRRLLSACLNADPQIEVVGAAADPLQARQMIKALDPQVLTLDVEMPHMDGLTFLEKVMTLRPMPVVMVSSQTQPGAEATIRALELGAIDFILKPTGQLQAGIDDFRAQLIGKVKLAARARLTRATRVRSPAAASVSAKTMPIKEEIIAIGASTGGVGALQSVIGDLPETCPGVLVAQHMPPGYTEKFARRLDTICRVEVREAEHSMPVLPGHVYVAPGGRHLELGRSSGRYVCKLHDGPPVSGHRPSVDVLFQSVAEQAKDKAVGVILTGMGSDGAAGLLAMRQGGARTFGESEASCVVYGMPRAAKMAGAVAEEVSLKQVARKIFTGCK